MVSDFDVVSVLNEMYPKMDTEDATYMCQYIELTIMLLQSVYNISHEIYARQLKQNNNMDIKAIINLHFPYITDDKKKEITSMASIYVGKKRVDIVDGVEKVFKYRAFDSNYMLLRETIYATSNKLHFNWQNILPVHPKDVGNTRAYIVSRQLWDTVNVLEEKIKLSTIDDSMFTIYTGDIYQTIFNDFYIKIKPIKWLLYDILIENIPYPSIYFLNTIFYKTLNRTCNYWESNTDKQKDFFLSEWASLKYAIANSSNYYLSRNATNTIKTIDRQIVDTFFKYFYYFLVSFIKRNHKDIIIDNGSDEDKENDSDEEFFIVTGTQLLKNINNIQPQIIFEFIKNTVNTFTKTFYYHRLIYNYEKINGATTEKFPFVLIPDLKSQMNVVLIKYDYQIGGVLLYTSSKNLYNFSKSFCHVKSKNGNWNELNKYWVSLLPTDKKIVVDRLNFDAGVFHNMQDDEKDAFCLSHPELMFFNTKLKIYDNPWFNISNSFKKLYPEKNTDDINLLITKVHNDIMADAFIIKLVLLSMSFKGVLTEFSPCPKLTDSKLMPDDEIKKKAYLTSELKKNIKDKHKSSYYYLTDDSFNNVPTIYLPEHLKCDIHKELNYFDALFYDNAWIFAYSFDWVSQISFYHHYMNNRVIFVTGATGTGKSTAIPVLALYSMKMIDYNYKGKIVNTQPRIPPTETNSLQISKQLGVPIKKYQKAFKKSMPSKNYHIQYQHRNDKHIDNSSDVESYLKIITDGTLYEILKKNPILKRKISVDSPEYTDVNIYDIIMIDESHEHNTNMDMILTIANYSVYYNNSLKLFIISATMDDDEERYRIFYKNIDDNRMYPLNVDLYTNFKWHVNRAHIDRRIDISPPDATTRFKIDKYYAIKDATEDNYLDLSVEKTISVANTTDEGDILLFLQGMDDINSACEKINKKTAKNIIAVPFYSDLDKSKLNFIQNIHEKLPLYRRNKMEEFDVDICSTQVSLGTYTRAIIVATNIAEASLTIANLKFVIDSCYSKNGTYNYFTGVNDLHSEIISTTSSIQRNGRVGRTSDGIVYKMLTEKSLCNNPMKYKIQFENFKSHFFGLLLDDSSEKIQFSRNKNINDSAYFIKNPALFFYEKKKGGYIPMELQSVTDPDEQYTKQFGDIDTQPIKNLISMIKKQYYLTSHKKEQNLFYWYSGNIRTVKIPPDYHMTGFSKKTLIDKDGLFYLIHPDIMNVDKLSVIQNVYEKSNEELYYRAKKNAHDPAFSVMMNIIVDTLNTSLYMADESKTKYVVELNKFSNTFDKIYERMEGTILMEACILSHIYKCDEELLLLFHLLHMLTAYTNGLFDLYNISGNNKKDSLAKFKNIFGQNTDDIGALYNFTQKLMAQFPYEPNIDDKSYTREYKETRAYYLSIRDGVYNNKILNTDLTADVYYIMQVIENSKWLNADKFFFIKKNVKEIIGKNTVDVKIKKWANVNGINEEFVTSLMGEYYKGIILSRIIKVGKDFISSKEWLLQNMSPFWLNDSRSVLDKLKIIMMKTYGNNLIYKCDKNKYIAINSNININLVSAATIPNKEDIDTVIDEHSYLLYLNDTKGIKKILLKINLRSLFELAPYKNEVRAIIGELKYIMNNRKEEFVNFENVNNSVFRDILLDITNKYDPKYLLKQAEIGDNEIRNKILKIFYIDNV